MKKTFYVVSIGSKENNDLFYFTGQWKYGTNPMFSSDIEKATHYTVKKQAEDFNRQRQMGGTVIEINICGD